MDKQFAKLQYHADEMFEERKKITMDYFQEDWQLSQFWYDDATADFIASRALENTDEGEYIAFISSPTAYVALSKLASENSNAFLFEYDMRFDVFKDRFVFYDFNKPLEVARASELKGKFKFIVVDPPFLNRDCLSQIIETAKFLAADGAKIMISTGAVMEKLANELVGARVTNFCPAHRGGLANEFCCYSTFEDGKLKWQQKPGI
ncbi:Protein-lysine N-methyltransferase efm5 [Coemansia sp. RSA 2559]|nr:Protein-lysine N-methyltransferase efm5 [Coemansia sp. RSA 2559]KAJ2853602.1 Protein-lysine N-methyltransferase efm5 [Coemansia erecta]